MVALTRQRELAHVGAVEFRAECPLGDDVPLRAAIAHMVEWMDEHPEAVPLSATFALDLEAEPGESGLARVLDGEGVAIATVTLFVEAER